MRRGVVDVAPVTHALETARGVHALAVGAHIGHQLAFVDLYGFVGHRVDDETGGFTAERFVLT